MFGLWVEVWDIAIVAARYSGSIYGEAIIENGYGLIFSSHAKDYGKSKTHFEKSLELVSRIDYQPGEALVFGNMSFAFRNLGDLESALEMALKSREMWQAVGDSWGRADSELAVGLAYSKTGLLESALECFARSYDLHVEIKDIWGAAVCMEEMAEVHQLACDDTQAVSCLKVAQDLYGKAGHRWGVATTLESLGQLLKRDGESEEARDSWSQAIAIFETEDPERAAQIREQLDALT